jgi:hypothetical protein
MFPAKLSAEMPASSGVLHLGKVNPIAVQVWKNSGTHHWIKPQPIPGGPQFLVLAEIQGQFKFQLFMGVLPLESGVGLLAAFDTKTKGKSGCSAFSVHESL